MEKTPIRYSPYHSSSSQRQLARDARPGVVSTFSTSPKTEHPTSEKELITDEIGQSKLSLHHYCNSEFNLSLCYG